jgi:hypothetical protein
VYGGSSFESVISLLGFIQRKTYQDIRDTCILTLVATPFIIEKIEVTDKENV